MSFFCFRSCWLGPEKNGKKGITEERVQVEDGCGSNSTYNAVIDEGQLVKVDLNNNLL